MSSQATVLIIDNDRDVAELVRALLGDEGYAVSVLSETTADAIAAAVARVEPDCVLLDGESGAGGDYGRSWLEAARLHVRRRAVPVVMFTAHQADTEEAIAGTSARAREAAFAGVIPKPFDIDELLATVARAVDRAERFDRSEKADARRTDELVARLEAAGAQDIRRSSRREWVTFRDADGRLLQLYWWENGGCYYVGAYPGNGSRLETIGLFYDVDAAVERATRAMAGEGLVERSA